MTDETYKLIERINKRDESRHKLEPQIRKYSEKRLTKINSDIVKSVGIRKGTEVYYFNKKLSKTSENYSSKLTQTTVGKN